MDLLGQHRKEPSISPIDTFPPSDPVAKEVPLEKIEILPPKIRPRDYSKQIAQAKKFHERGAAVYAAIAENLTYAVFDDPFTNINQAYERFNTEKDGNSREKLLTLYSSMLNAAKFGNVQRDINSAANEIAKFIIEYYDEQTSTIFSDQPFSNLSPRYTLNADLRANQLAKISTIIVGHFSNVISEMKDIEQRRNSLQSSYQAFVGAINDEFDWGAAARNFGVGALAVANPIIGIPALIANFKLQSDKGKAESAQIGRYAELFDEFENKIFSVREHIIQGTEQTKNYVAEKFKEINSLAITIILSDIAANGGILDHYFKSLDYKELEDAERDFLSEGA